MPSPSNADVPSLRPQIGFVVIGRNEGERLRRCFASLQDVPTIVYVDSGSTDQSVNLALSIGATVVELAVPPHFTAARARNAGIARLVAENPDVRFVHTLDGDCEILPGWTEAAYAMLQARPDLALVFGRLHERHPELSIYNALCDDEWNVPVGEAAGCGGIALHRIAALQSIGGFNEAMISAEDSEMCMRLRKQGWRLERIDRDMALHDANITRFGQWWRRTKRGGHGFAEMAHLHPDARWPDWPRTCRSIMVWGALLPLLLLATVMASLINPWWLIASAAIAGLYPFKMGVIALRKRRSGLRWPVALASGVLLMVGKFPELLGLIQFHRNRMNGRQSGLIEYKGAAPT